MKNKRFISLILLIALFLPVIVNAQPDFGMEYAEELGLSPLEDDPRNVLVSVVRYLMTFLALFAVVVVLLGGFRWMTSMGNEDRLAMAKATVLSGMIGLAVIITSFAIVNFVINATTSVLADGNIL